MISNKLYYKAIAVKFWMEKEKYSFDSYYWCYVEVQDDPERVKEKTLNFFLHEVWLSLTCFKIWITKTRSLKKLWCKSVKMLREQSGEIKIL